MPTAGAPGTPLVISLVTDAETHHPIVRVTGWSGAELAALHAASLAPDDWQPLARVQVAGGADVPVAAQARVTADAVELVPRFALEPGRAYDVTIDPTRAPAFRPDGLIRVRVSVPARPPSAASVVSAIYPSSPVWPENTLRFYLHFTAPMSGTSAVGHVRLIDGSGAEVADALLEVDVDLWNREYTRRTVFFDPGRVKHGIKPNVELGRALIAGRDYTIVVSQGWLDANGRPLAQEFRHSFTAGPALDRPVMPAKWIVDAPLRGTRDPLVVRFPHALDEGLLQRAVGVEDGKGNVVDGLVSIGAGELSWSFTPAALWRDNAHNVVVLTLLEDPAGNKVGQAFEFEMFGQPQPAEPDRITLPFRPRP